MSQLKLLEIDAIDPNGATGKVLINPSKICFINPVTIPGKMAGPDGNPIGTPATLLNFGATSIVMNHPVDEVKKILEGN